MAEYVPINISSGDTFELETYHATGDITFSLYFQNQTTETLHNETLQYTHEVPANAYEEVKYWHFDSSGRAILKVKVLM